MEPTQEFEDFKAPDEPVLGDGSDGEDALARIEQKKARKPYTKRRKASEKSDAPVGPDYYSSQIWGEFVNLPFKIMEIITKYPNWAIDAEQKEQMGAHLGNVIRGFFPDLKEENEKYMALVALCSLFLGTFGVKFTEWKIVTASVKKDGNSAIPKNTN